MEGEEELLGAQGREQVALVMEGAQQCAKSAVQISGVQECKGMHERHCMGQGRCIRIQVCVREALCRSWRMQQRCSLGLGGCVSVGMEISLKQ